MFVPKPPSEREVAFSKKMTEGACVYDEPHTPFGCANRRRLPPACGIPPSRSGARRCFARGMGNNPSVILSEGRSP